MGDGFHVSLLDICCEIHDIPSFNDNGKCFQHNVGQNMDCWPIVSFFRYWLLDSRVSYIILACLVNFKFLKKRKKNREIKLKQISSYQSEFIKIYHLQKYLSSRWLIFFVFSTLFRWQSSMDGEGSVLSSEVAASILSLEVTESFTTDSKLLLISI